MDFSEEFKLVLPLVVKQHPCVPTRFTINISSIYPKIYQYIGRIASVNFVYDVAEDIRFRMAGGHICICDGTRRLVDVKFTTLDEMVEYLVVNINRADTPNVSYNSVAVFNETDNLDFLILANMNITPVIIRNLLIDIETHLNIVYAMTFTNFDTTPLLK